LTPGNSSARGALEFQSVIACRAKEIFQRPILPCPLLSYTSRRIHLQPKTLLPPRLVAPPENNF
jgi:hypothetical protein